MGLDVCFLVDAGVAKAAGAIDAGDVCLGKPRSRSVAEGALSVLQCLLQT